jgi:hypothetical protein
MAGHRDDGTVHEDRAHHPNRKVSHDAIMDRHIAQQQAMWKGVDTAGIASHVSELDEDSRENDNASPYGIPRPNLSHLYNEDDAPAHGIPRPNLDEVLDPWDPEDIEEQYKIKEERLKKGYY